MVATLSVTCQPFPPPRTQAKLTRLSRCGSRSCRRSRNEGHTRPFRRQVVALGHSIRTDAVINSIVVVVLIVLGDIEVVDTELAAKGVHHWETEVSVTLEVLICRHALTRHHEANVFFHNLVAVQMSHDVAHLFGNALALGYLQQVLIGLVMS